ncbi:hypothetical protein JTE90_023952 [Oedothorax gibbosus]|uniref:Uncharacterized protein n=1 Tax=Oedothorax gibbosus TaxID=931172 RepID=A0AAV6UQR2_9ARAC|nr:hypothetical protein JTE90_023952 [Oedothorax gibbosus]
MTSSKQPLGAQFQHLLARTLRPNRRLADQKLSLRQPLSFYFSYSVVFISKQSKREKERRQDFAVRGAHTTFGDITGMNLTSKF